MTDPRELLDALAKEGAGEYGERVEETAPELVAALRAVLDIHNRDADNGCEACGIDAYEEPIAWPCPTIRAITTALEAS